MPQHPYQRKLFYFLFAVIVFKIIIACLVELGNDEVYYYTYAFRPDWSYFDHPPLVGLFIRLTTFNLLFVNDVTMRLGAIIGSAIASYFIYKTVTVIRNEKAGWYAALLYNCSLYGGVISGLFILPDSPQMPFWTASLYIMSLLLFTNSNKKNILFLLLGLSIGLATLSKVHALFLWLGFGLFLLVRQRKFFAEIPLYVSGIITAVCLLPIIIWNVNNHFITYTYHSERVTHHTIQVDTFMQEVIGEAIYQNPIVYVLLLVAVIFFIRKKQFFSNDQQLWLLCMSMPMLLVFWGVSLFNPTLPHWSGPAFIPLMMMGGMYLSEKSSLWIPGIIKWAGGFMVAVLIAGAVAANIAPFNLGSKAYDRYGEYCPTLDISGWKTFGNDFKTLVANDSAKHIMQNGAPIIVAKWFPAAHIEMYVARQTKQEVLGVGKLEDLHEFAWMNKSRKALKTGEDAYCIVPSNIPFDVEKEYKQYFQTIEKPEIINQVRGGKMVRYFKIYRLKNCIKLPQPVL